MKMILSPFYCATSGAVQSPVRFVKWKFDKRDSCGTRGIGLWLGRHFALHNYACSIAIGVVSISCLELSGLSHLLLQSVPSLQVSVAMPYYSIVMVSIGSLSTRSPSVSTFSSGECGNAILQCYYGFNRLS